MIRIGHGFDVHKFGDKGPLTLGGVKVPYEQGFVAHSDGDVVLHAVCDSLLGALALGDIGAHFPDTDHHYKNINSRILLKEVFAKITAKGYILGNLDITIIAEEPKMQPHIPQMRINIAEDLHAHFELVSVKATTSERLGFTGRKEGIACEAVVLLKKIMDN